MGMQLTPDDLLPGEEVLVSLPANLWIKPSQHGLSRFAAGTFLGDNEALGGHAYLTNFRVIFKSHGLNRLTGMRSLFLPTIVRIERGWLGIRIESRVQVYKFVMWFNRGFVEQAKATIAEFDDERTEQLRDLVRANPERMGTLAKQELIEAVNKVLLGVVTVAEVVTHLASPERGLLLELVSLLSSSSENKAERSDTADANPDATTSDPR